MKTKKTNQESTNSTQKMWNRKVTIGKMAPAHPSELQ